MLGASRSRAFRHVTLPLLAPSIIAAASIVFLFTFTSFGVVLLLSDPAHATLEVEIYRQAIELFDLQTAAALALVQIVAVLAVVFALARAQERRGDRAAAGRRGGHGAPAARAGAGRRRRDPRRHHAVPRPAVAGARLAFAARRRGVEPGVVPGARFELVDVDAVRLAVGRDPQLGRVRGDRHGDRTRRRRAGVGRRSRRVRAGRRASMDAFLMLPLGTSAVTIGFGFLLAFQHAPNGLATSPLLVPIAHAVVAIPFVIRAVVPALRSIDPRLRDAATMLGAGPAPGVARGRPPDHAARASRSRPGSARRSRSGSSARRCSSPGPTGRRFRSRSSGSWRARVRSTSTRRWRCR